jgi:RHS repeat-associated protein
MEKVTGDCTSHGTITDTWTFTYDGDGIRVKEEYSGTGDSYTKYFFAGGAYEVYDDGSSTTTKRYYSIAGMMVAMDDGTDLVYFAQDHLSSASLVMDDSGTLQSENRYMPFGEVRDINGVTNITETDFGYTGQRNITDIGLMDYNARFYSPTLMRFIQPDTIVPDSLRPQSFNRYSYVVNNPMIFIDPTGNHGRPTNGCYRNPNCNSSNLKNKISYSPGTTLVGGSGSNGGAQGGSLPGGADEDVEEKEKEKNPPNNPSISIKGEAEYEVTIEGSWIELGTFADSWVIWGDFPLYANDNGFGVASSGLLGYIDISYDYTGKFTFDIGLGLPYQAGDSGIGASLIYDTSTGPLVNLSGGSGWTGEGRYFIYNRETSGNQETIIQKGVYGKNKHMGETMLAGYAVGAFAIYAYAKLQAGQNPFDFPIPEGVSP